MISLWLVRHSAPTERYAQQAYCYGVTEIALDADHFSLSETRLRECLPRAPRVWVSPRLRCQKLAEALYPDDHQIDPRIAEMNFGRWEHRPWDDIVRSELDCWAAGFWQYRDHGGESVLEFATRVASALTEAARDGGDQPMVWVTHQGVIRVVRALLSETGLMSLGQTAGIDFGTGIAFQIDQTHVRGIEASLAFVRENLVHD